MNVHNIIGILKHQAAINTQYNLTLVILLALEYFRFKVSANYVILFPNNKMDNKEQDKTDEKKCHFIGNPKLLKKRKCTLTNYGHLGYIFLSR